MKTFLTLLFAAVPLLAQARPDTDRSIGPSVVDRPSATYRHERFELDAPAGPPAGRIDLLVPRQAPPASGFPVLYVLDGNAVLDTLRDDWLDEIAHAPQPPVLVLVGYASDRRFEIGPRTRDYTPVPAAGPGGQVAGGGAAAFRAWLETAVKPEVGRRVAVDGQRQGLWGHSFGGLFVLDTLFEAPDDYRYWFAASPSLWWSNGAELATADRYLARPTRPAGQLLLMRGAQEAGELAAATGPAGKQRGSVPPETLPALTDRLGRSPGLQVRFVEVAGLGHGPLLPLSLHAALRSIAGLPAEVTP